MLIEKKELKKKLFLNLNYGNGMKCCLKELSHKNILGTVL